MPRQRTLGAELDSAAIAERGEANIVVATGASQFEMLANLLNSQTSPGIELLRFISTSMSACPSSTRRPFVSIFGKRFVSRLPMPLRIISLHKCRDGRCG